MTAGQARARAQFRRERAAALRRLAVQLERESIDGSTSLGERIASINLATIKRADAEHDERQAQLYDGLAEGLKRLEARA